MYDVNKYLLLTSARSTKNKRNLKAFYPDTPIVHDDEERKSSDMIDWHDATTPTDRINDFSQNFTSWDTSENKYVTREIPSDEYRNLNAPTGRRRHQPHYENRFRIDTSSVVCITRRKNGVEVSGASDELETEIRSNVNLLQIDVTITLDEYNTLVG